jgi:hypothetical protein
MLLRRPLLSSCCAHRSRRRKTPTEWAVEDILAHEWTPDGFKFLIKWAGTKRNGEPHENSWEPVSGVSDGLVDDYFARIEQMEKKEVTADISPLVNQARKMVKERLSTGSTKCRPRVHEVQLDGLSLKALALAFLEIVRRPSNVWLRSSADSHDKTAKPLPIEYTKDPSDGVECWQVNLLNIDQVAGFCALHSFLGCKDGVGAMRYNIGRASNVEIMLVGVPMVFKVIGNRSDGLVTTTITFPTVWVNGTWGTMTPPPQRTGMLRDTAHFNRVLAYAKKYLPPTHPLAAKGWKCMPAGMHTLPQGEGAEPAAYVDSSDEED